MLLAPVLICVTLLVVLGYFVLLTSSRAEGTLKAFGKYLAIWLFILPVLLIIAAATMGRWHTCPGMERSWFHQPSGYMPGAQPGPGTPALAQPPATGIPQPAPNAAPAAQ